MSGSLPSTTAANENRRAMVTRTTRLVAALSIGTALLLAVAVTIVVAGRVAHPELVGAEAVWGTVSFALPIAAFAAVGGLIAVRQPGNAIGWLMVLIGLLLAIVIAAGATSSWGLKSGSLPKGLSEWIDVPANLWVIALGLLGTQLPMRLPDGRLPSPGWRAYSRLTLVLIAVACVGMATHTGRVEGVDGTSNPLGSAVLEPLGFAILVVFAAFAGGVRALVVRHRRAAAVERVQLRWIMFGGAAFFVVFVVTLVPNLAGVPGDSAAGYALTFTSQTAFAALPVAIGYAIMRHRLLDIDVVINRTLVYGVLTATLAVVYVGSVLLLQLMLNGVAGDSSLAVAISTLAVAGLFRPARARIQRGVDRRFFRRRYDSQRTLETFSARLRDEVALDALSSELVGVVRETLQPAHVSLWLRERR